MNGGEINIRKTHPNLYWIIMAIILTSIGLGSNFILRSPTFPIFGAPNELWGAIFLALGFGQFISLNVFRRLRLVRAFMAFSMAYMMFLAAGTMEPGLAGKASFQLPIIYAGMTGLQIPLLVEPFINPGTARP